jgi:hypothetical protein
MMFETAIAAVFIWWAVNQKTQLDKYKELEARRTWSQKAVEEYKKKCEQEQGTTCECVIKEDK